MSKISKSTRNNITLYAKDIDVRLDLAELCNSITEVDAVALCLFNIEQAKADYQYSKYAAPKDPVRRNRNFYARIRTLTPEELELELDYMNKVEHLTSQTKLIKNNLVHRIESLLKDTGIGKKRRLLMMPLFIDELTDDEEN